MEVKEGQELVSNARNRGTWPEIVQELKRRWSQKKSLNKTWLLREEREVLATVAAVQLEEPEDDLIQGQVLHHAKLQLKKFLLTKSPSSLSSTLLMKPQKMRLGSFSRHAEKLLTFS